MAAIGVQGFSGIPAATSKNEEVKEGCLRSLWNRIKSWKVTICSKGLLLRQAISAVFFRVIAFFSSTLALKLEVVWGHITAVWDNFVSTFKQKKLTTKIEALAEENLQLKRERDALQREATRFKEEVVGMDAERRPIDEENARLQMQVRALQTAQERLTLESRQKGTQMDRMVREHQEMRTKLEADFRKEREPLGVENVAMKSRLRDQERELVGLRQASEESVLEMRRIKKEHQESLQKVRGESTPLSEQNAALRAEIRTQKMEVQRATEKGVEALADMSEERNGFERELRECQGTLRKLEARLAETQNADSHKPLLQELERIRSLYEEARAHGMPGISFNMAALIEQYRAVKMQFHQDLKTDIARLPGNHKVRETLRSLLDVSEKEVNLVLSIKHIFDLSLFSAQMYMTQPQPVHCGMEGRRGGVYVNHR